MFPVRKAAVCIFIVFILLLLAPTPLSDFIKYFVHNSNASTVVKVTVPQSFTLTIPNNSSNISGSSIIVRSNKAGTLIITKDNKNSSFIKWYGVVVSNLSALEHNKRFTYTVL